MTSRLATISLLMTLAGACATPGAPGRESPLPSGLAGSSAPREQTADQQVQHVLSRLAFGPRPGEVQRVREMGVDRWMELQLHPQGIPDGEMTAFTARFATLRLNNAQLAREYPPPQALAAAQQRAGMSDSLRDPRELREARERAQIPMAELTAARVARAVASERQLEEVMVDFWLNHFSVFAGKGAVRQYLIEYERDAIRPHALGNFRSLLGAVAHSPAMLFYLDNWQSGANPDQPTLGQLRRGPVRAGPQVRPPPATQSPTMQLPASGQPRRPGLNENYARELLELHTLGVDGGYTQKDVTEVARAFTGWSLQNPREGGSFAFRPEIHDAGTKVILGVAFAPGRGIDDGEQVLDLLARHPATARFISTKLVRRLVSDDPPEALVSRAAATFTRTGGDIREVVRTIITSSEFFSAEAYRSKVKTPFELVVSTARALGAAPDPTPRSARLVATLGQPIFGKESPNGWPDVAGAWMNTGSILNRINFGNSAAAGQVPGVSVERWPLAAELRNAPREQQVDGVIAALLGGAASSDTRAILMQGRNPLGQRGPQELAGLPQIVGLALGSPEFQRR